MTSVLVSPEGYYEYEAAHGTVQRHYYRHLKGRAINKLHGNNFRLERSSEERGELDSLPELVAFADKLEKASIQTIEDGVMTKDLAMLCSDTDLITVNTEGFLREIDKRLSKML